jgi:Arc/MetJ-type ribon-helix-helix transcriptional regulator
VLDDPENAGNTFGMNSEKIAISIPKPLVTRARAAVRRGRARSVSAYIAAALEEKSKLDNLEELLEQMLSESGGPLSVSEKNAADAALGISPRRNRGTKDR